MYVCSLDSPEVRSDPVRCVPNALSSPEPCYMYNHQTINNTSGEGLDWSGRYCPTRSLSLLFRLIDVLLVKLHNYSAQDFAEFLDILNHARHIPTPTQTYNSM